MPHRNDWVRMGKGGGEVAQLILEVHMHLVPDFSPNGLGGRGLYIYVHVYSKGSDMKHNDTFRLPEIEKSRTRRQLFPRSSFIYDIYIAARILCAFVQNAHIHTPPS